MQIANIATRQLVILKVDKLELDAFAEAVDLQLCEGETAFDGGRLLDIANAMLKPLSIRLELAEDWETYIDAPT